MEYRIQFKPRAIKDLKALPKETVRRIVKKIEALQNNLEGDVKKLTNYSPEYRLRVGTYRVLFEVDDDEMIIYRILHRKDAY
jgi:mRNA interferase RelE/StbE